jgi:hypothetical protein
LAVVICASVRDANTHTAATASAAASDHEVRGGGTDGTNGEERPARVALGIRNPLRGCHTFRPRPRRVAGIRLSPRDPDARVEVLRDGLDRCRQRVDQLIDLRLLDDERR